MDPENSSPDQYVAERRRRQALTSSGILLDTHALYWIVSGEFTLSDAALAAIGESQVAGKLFVSPITSWELSVASQKNCAAGRPHLGDVSPAPWFRRAVAVTRVN